MVNLQAAGEFIRTNGREIDVALFEYHFGGGSRSAVIDALEHYQNGDGGFGHGLEPDITGPASNPFAIDLALSIVAEAAIPPESPMVQRCARYLEDAQSDD